MFNLKICILNLVIIRTVFATTDYCSASLCRGQGTHIACGNNGQFASTCQNPQSVPMTSELRNLILNQHNLFRNRIASGSLPPFPSAVRMATMRWNEELARLADLNVKRCQMRHDACRNTKQFPYAGQNLGQRCWWGMNIEVTENINTITAAWSGEYLNCPVDVIDSYRSSTSGAVYGHFTAMVQDESTDVGCAVVLRRSNNFDCFNFACNYAKTNMLREPVYRKGPAASQCSSGRNEQFSALCSSAENYRN